MIQSTNPDCQDMANEVPGVGLLLGCLGWLEVGGLGPRVGGLIPTWQFCENVSENVTLSKARGDLQRLGIKRSL